MKDPNYFASYAEQRYEADKESRMKSVEKDVDEEFKKMYEEYMEEKERILRNGQRAAFLEKRRIIGEAQTEGLIAIESVKQQSFESVFKEILLKLETIFERRDDGYYALIADQIKKARGALDAQEVVVQFNGKDFENKEQILNKLDFRADVERSDIEGCVILNKSRTRMIEITPQSIVESLKDTYGGKVISMMQA